MKKKKLIITVVFSVLLIFLVVFGVIFIFGREKTVEDLTNDFFKNYSKLDSSVVSKIKYDGDKLNSKQKKKYVNIIKNQYSKLEYEIKDIKEEAHLTFVTVEVDVYDLGSALEQANSYINNYNEKFLVDGKFNNEKANDYRLESLESVKKKVTYTIKFTYQKIDSKYVMHDLSNADLKKIDGTY